MPLVSIPSDVMSAERERSGDSKLSAPVLNATAAVAEDGSIVITIPAGYSKQAFSRAQKAPKGYRDKDGKMQSYPWGCQIDLGGSGFNAFFLGIKRSGADR